jgi:hypothetical protein
MSTVPTLCLNPCETCDKKGLPLLLTRYALIPAASKAPELGGQLKLPELDTVPLGKGARYGLRLLRSGYAYIFDEARSHWDEYFVTRDGFFSKLPTRIRAFKAPPKPATEFACARNGVAPIAGVITIKNPKHATTVWIGFSDVEWTDAVFMQHQESAHRARHMTSIRISGGKVAAQPGTAPLEQVGQLLVEFSLPKDQIASQFSSWSPHQFNSRTGQLDSFNQAMKTTRPEGGAAIVALHDPIGLVMEIAALMELNKATFMNHESVTMPRFAASTIASLESTVKEQAKLAEIEAGERLAQDAGSSAMYPNNPALWGMQGGDPSMAEKWRTHTPEQLKKVSDNAWKKYTHDRTGKPRFNQPASQAWLKSYNESFQTFDVEYIAPLAKAHVAWMKHQRMISTMSCNYDSTDRESGVAYTATVVDLLCYTLDKQPSYDLYVQWLGAGDYADSNLLMRAMGFNQTALIDKLTVADAAPVDGRAFPTDASVKAVADFMEKMPASANGQLTALLAGISGPSLKYWNDFNAGKVGGKAAAGMAAVSGKQFVRIPITGNKGQFIQAYMKTLCELDPSIKIKTTNNKLQAAISKQLKLLEIEGVKMNGNRKLGWYQLLDKQAVASASSNSLSGQALADELVKAIRTPQDIEKLDAAKAARFRTVAAGTGTALSGILMALNYTKLLNDVENGMSHDLGEAKTKLALGRIAIGGFVAEQLGIGLKLLGEMRLRNMMGRFGGYLPNVLRIAGRFAGFGTGVVLGIWDISKGQQAYEQGDRGLAFAYRLSGAAAIGVSTAMYAVAMGWVALGPIGWFLVAAGVLVWLVATFFVETMKDNSRQEWLSRCHFGAAPESNRYKDVKTHSEQYERALAN